MQHTYYYSDELNDDFAGTKIARKPLPEDYRYVRTDAPFRAGRFIVYRLFATPLIALAGLLCGRIRNRRATRGFRRGGAFIYGNHTCYLGDALNPTRIAFPRAASVVVNPDAVSIPAAGGLVRLLGGVPVPEDIAGLKNFSRDIISAAERDEWVAIYPEAHIWPYYTGIRPFGAAAFMYPAKCGLPVFAYTTVYKKRRFFKKPRREVWVDGPFFAEGATAKARAESLRAQVYAAMVARAETSDCEYCVYRRVSDGAVAAALNSAQRHGGEAVSAGDDRAQDISAAAGING